MKAVNTALNAVFLFCFLFNFEVIVKKTGMDPRGLIREKNDAK